MLSKRNRIFLPLLLVLFVVPTLSAQLSSEDRMNLVAPSSSGETGLFTMLTGDTLRRGDWSFGLYYNNYDFLAAEPTPEMRIPSRRAFREFDYDMDVISASIGVGLTDRWELVASIPYVRLRQNANDQSGFINGYPYQGEFNDSGIGNIHIGTKIALLDPMASKSRLALSFGLDAPTGDEEGGISSGNAGYGVGLHWSHSVLALGASWKNPGERDADDSPFGENFENNDEVHLDAGLNIPIGASMTNWVTELNTIFFNGGDADQEDVVNLTTGIRTWFGTSGWGLSAGLRSNLSMLGGDGDDACPIGGVFGLHYAPVHFTEMAPPPLPPVYVPPPPAPEPTPVVPTPEPVAPPRQPQVLRTDEIHFESGSARLTNIAKAILDDVALRMKQEPTSAAVVIGYTDNRENTGAGSDLDRRRAEAVRDYLVSRHGIDSSRISVEARNGQDMVGDNTTAEGRLKNRRVVIRLMIP